MSGDGISGKHSRRDFMKYVGAGVGTLALVTGAGKVANAVPGPSSTLLNAEDYPVVTTTDDLEDITVREVRDHAVDNSYVGLPVIAYMNDATGASTGWELIGTSENISSLIPGSTGNMLYTDVLPPALAEQFYTMDYRGRHDFDLPAGMTHTIEDQIDRYKTDLTVTYEVNGSTETVSVNIPNVVAKQVFGWDPGEAIPFYSVYGLDPLTQPDEFEDAMTTLYQVLADEGLEDSIMKNRNTGLPPLPDPNPWFETRQLLMDLGEDPMTIDDLYPTGMLLEMTDYGK